MASCLGSTAPYAPKEPIGQVDDAFRRFVEADLCAQCEIGADAYLIPGFVPRGRNDRVEDITLAAVDIALGMTDIDARPFIAFVDMHSERLDRGVELLGRLHRAIGGAYIQVTPFRPQSDTVSKLIRCTDVYAEVAKEFVVIAGRVAVLVNRS